MARWDNTAQEVQEPFYNNPSCFANNDNVLNILLVEDDHNDTLLTTRAVKATQIPCSMDCMTRGREIMPYLMNCLQDHMPDVMLLDMGLPDVTGFEILAMLAQAPARIRALPIIIVTGYSHFDYLPRAYQLPIMGYITKPLRAQEIEPLLQKALTMRT